MVKIEAPKTHKDKKKSKMMFQVSLVGTDLVIVNVSQSDAGTYTCELDTDDITPLAVSHTLQILGRSTVNISFNIFY